jgi:hypothetical protein
MGKMDLIEDAICHHLFLLLIRIFPKNTRPGEKKFNDWSIWRFAGLTIWRFGDAIFEG